MKWLALFLLFTLHAQSENFETLMGKETKHWANIKQEEDKKALEEYAALYVDNFPRLAQPGKVARIPKVVHFIWLGPRPFPPSSVENVRMWMAHHPDWTFKFWTDRERVPPCSDMEVVLIDRYPFASLADCYADTDNFGERSDLLRYEILYNEGGVYVDHDANCLKSFDSLHRAYDFYCCLETPHPSFAGRSITTGNGLVGSRPAHPVIAQVIQEISQRWATVGHQFRSNDVHARKERVLNRTYIALTHALPKTIGRNGNIDIVLPAAYFFSKTGIPSLYSKHGYATAWADDKVQTTEHDKVLLKTLTSVNRTEHQIWILALFACGTTTTLLVTSIIKLNRLKHAKAIAKRRELQ
jgi:hypothetical protein